jgi:CubicO group peptidase (beta-lactamase class C family)
VLLVPFVASQKPRTSTYDFSAVTERVQEWVDLGYYPGAAVRIAKDNQVVYERCFGNYTPQTEVLIASAGKWLAAATIMSLVDAGTLSLDDPASKWLPEFKDDSKGGATLRQMLSHTSGYPAYQPKDRPPDKYQTLVESVRHILPLAPVARPGERFEYGGLAMQVAGRMAEVATGMKWETLFQQRIAGPLRMAHTHFTPVDQDGGHSPMLGGGARSTLGDYASFLHMVAGNGLFEGRRVLSANAVRELAADQVRDAKVSPGEFVERVRGRTDSGIYGLGEWREELDGVGNATLISSPSWAGAYPWIDRTSGVYGVILAHVDVVKANQDRFSGFYASPILAMMVRDAVARGAKPASMSQSPGSAASIRQ